MKKIALLSSLSLIVIPITQVVSCSNSSPDYMKMLWDVDTEKINKLSSSYESFNSEPISIDKLKKIIKGDGSYIDEYTQKAFDDEWFESISFDGAPGKLVIKLKDKKQIGDKTIKCLYRLRNGGLSWRI